MSASLELARKIYRELSLYAPDRAPCAIDLSDNTNLFGVPPAAQRAILAVTSNAVTRYPNLYAAELKRALAGYIGVAPEELVTGCGSDDVLDSAIRAFAEPGEKLAYPDPTFAMVPTFAKMNGLVPVPVPFGAGRDLDVDALLATGAKIIYLCSPNNPTGGAASRRKIEAVIRSAPGLVILDEAYAEYAREAFAAEAPAMQRVLAVRTLSKAFGLAGLRIGYATGAKAIVAEVEKSRGPYKINAIAERAAIAALTEDREWVQRGVDEVKQNRARFLEELRAIGLKPLPSEANFVLVPVPDALKAGKAMRELGVAVRPFPSLPQDGDALRISVGPWSMMQPTLDALVKVLR